MNNMFVDIGRKVQRPRRFDFMIWDKRKANFKIGAKKKKQSLWGYVNLKLVNQMTEDMKLGCPHWNLETLLNIPTKEQVMNMSKFDLTILGRLMRLRITVQLLILSALAIFVSLLLTKEYYHNLSLHDYLYSLSVVWVLLPISIHFTLTKTKQKFHSNSEKLIGPFLKNREMELKGVVAKYNKLYFYRDGFAFNVGRYGSYLILIPYIGKMDFGFERDSAGNVIDKKEVSMNSSYTIDPSFFSCTYVGESLKEKSYLLPNELGQEGLEVLGEVDGESGSGFKGNVVKDEYRKSG